MPLHNDIFPIWVLINDELRNVSEFAYLKGKDANKRPKAFCPVCGDEVTMKLGTKKVHHYAHKNIQNCPASETPLHYNTKFHIYKQLLKAQAITINYPCERCEKVRKLTTLIHQTWIADWDSVEIEYRTHSFTPDIALLKSGDVVAAIEVKVTHETEEDKAQFYKRQRIQWLELTPTEEIYRGHNAWTASQPLDFDRVEPIPQYKCNYCIEKEQKIAEQMKRVALLEEAEKERKLLEEKKKQDNATYVANRRKELGNFACHIDEHMLKDETIDLIHCFKVIDMYRENGQYQRYVMTITRHNEAGVFAYATLAIAPVENIEKKQIITSTNTKIIKARDINNLYGASTVLYIKQMRKECIVHEFGIWRKLGMFNQEELILSEATKLPSRMSWDKQQKCWIEN